MAAVVSNLIASVNSALLPLVSSINKFVVPYGVPAFSPVTLLATVAVLYFITKIFSKPKGNFPPVISGLPFIGVAVSFGQQPVQFILDAYKKHGSCFSVKMFGNEMTYLVGPDAHEKFFRADDDIFSVRDAYQWTVKVFGPGVVYHAENDVFVQQLKFLKNGLIVNRLKTYIPMIENETIMYTQKWANEGKIDIFEAMCELTILTASRCLLGEEIRTTLNERFAQLYHDLEGGFTPLGLFFPNMPAITPGQRGRDRAQTAMQELFAGVIAERRKHGIRHDDMLQNLMDSQYKDGTQLPDHHITGMLIALLFAGQHTSSITASWVGLNIIANKNKNQLLARLLEEQKKVIGENSVDFENLQQMHLLHACMREVLRMYPPLIQVMRKVVKPFKFDGYDIPVGNLVAVSTAAAGYLPDVWKNPTEYDPDRYLSPREEDKEHAFKWLGFGAGRHACMGEQFAYLQVKTIWSTLLRRFDFEMDQDLPLPDYTTMVVGPRKPCDMVYKRKKFGHK